MKILLTIIIGITLVGCATGLGSLYVMESNRKYEQERLELQKKLEEERAKIEERYQREIAQAQREIQRSPPAAAPIMAAPPASPNRQNFKFDKGEPTGGGSKIELAPQIVKPVQSASAKETVSSKLFKANLAFAIQGSANINDDIKAQLLIDPNQLLEDLNKNLQVEGRKILKTIEISEVVKASLVAPEFVVTKITEEEQVISDHKATEWTWSLKPRSPGLHEVNLTVTAIIKINGRESRYHLKAFEQKVLVEITKQQILESWFKEHWKWVFGSLLFPLLGFILKDKFKKWLSK